MSHFVGFVFGSNVDELLEPYDENMVVDAYVRYTKDEAVDEVKRRHADNYEYALKVLDKYQDPKSDWEKEQVERANKIIEGGIGISYEDAWEEAKKWGYDMDDNENLLSTYNPESKWDWITMRMGVIAISENNLHLQICRLGKEYPGVYVEGCMSPKIFGLNIKPTKASITSGCTCSVQTYGIGEYDTCKMGCKYCYATIDHNLAKRIPENPNSELISGEITEPIKYVNNRVQISQELSLFD